MKKLALSLILACLSVSAAFAQNVSDTGVSTSASVPQAEPPSVQDVAAVAHKAGAFVGGLFNGTFQVGSALFSGLKTGVTGLPSAEAKVEPMQATSNDAQSLTGLPVLFKATRHEPAPVEDRSIYSAAASQ